MGTSLPGSLTLPYGRRPVILKKLAQAAGIEPATTELTARYSTTELRLIVYSSHRLRGLGALSAAGTLCAHDRPAADGAVGTVRKRLFHNY